MQEIRKKEIKTQVLFSFGFFFLFFAFFFVFNAAEAKAAVNLDQYCSSGYYRIPNEQVCSRGPCCGTDDCSVDKYEKNIRKYPAPNPQQCMGDNGDKNRENGCGGYVPACCYEVERTGDPLKCAGYWERLWCAPSQCASINPQKAEKCGGGLCDCGHAFGTYCGADTKPIPIEDRLGIKPEPTAVPKAPSATPTAAPITPKPENTQPVEPTPKPSTKKTTKNPFKPNARKTFKIKGKLVVIGSNELIKKGKIAAFNRDTRKSAESYNFIGYNAPIYFTLDNLQQGSTYYINAYIETASGFIFNQTNSCKLRSLRYSCLVDGSQNIVLVIDMRKQKFAPKRITKAVHKIFNVPADIVVKTQKFDGAVQKKIDSLLVRIVQYTLKIVGQKLW